MTPRTWSTLLAHRNPRGRWAPAVDLGLGQSRVLLWTMKKFIIIKNVIDNKNCLLLHMSWKTTRCRTSKARGFCGQFQPAVMGIRSLNETKKKKTNILGELRPTVRCDIFNNPTIMKSGVWGILIRQNWIRLVPRGAEQCYLHFGKPYF